MNFTMKIEKKVISSKIGAQTTISSLNPKKMRLMYWGPEGPCPRDESDISTSLDFYHGKKKRDNLFSLFLLS